MNKIIIQCESFLQICVLCTVNRYMFCCSTEQNYWKCSCHCNWELSVYRICWLWKCIFCVAFRLISYWPVCSMLNAVALVVCLCVNKSVFCWELPVIVSYIVVLWNSLYLIWCGIDNFLLCRNAECFWKCHYIAIAYYYCYYGLIIVSPHAKNYIC
jgi:hypothetical protein